MITYDKTNIIQMLLRSHPCHHFDNLLHPDSNRRLSECRILHWSQLDIHPCLWLFNSLSQFKTGYVLNEQAYLFRFHLSIIAADHHLFHSDSGWLHQVQRKHHRGKPWKIRIEFIKYNRLLQSKRSLHCICHVFPGFIVQSCSFWHHVCLRDLICQL